MYLWQNKVMKKQKQEITFTDGSIYVGEVKNDIPHGQGTDTSADGTKYVGGGFKNDSFHGQGTYTSADGAEGTGQYLNAKFVVDVDDEPVMDQSRTGKRISSEEDFKEEIELSRFYSQES